MRKEEQACTPGIHQFALFFGFLAVSISSVDR